MDDEADEVDDEEDEEDKEDKEDVEKTFRRDYGDRGTNRIEELRENREPARPHRSPPATRCGASHRPKMSNRPSGGKSGPPAHPNKTAYRHNKHSKKTQQILQLPVSGMCSHCVEVVEWRKKYRKYKPLSGPKKWYGSQPDTLGVDLAPISMFTRCTQSSLGLGVP